MKKNILSKFSNVSYPLFALKQKPYKIGYDTDKIWCMPTADSHKQTLDDKTVSGDYFARLLQIEKRVTFDYTCKNLQDLIFTGVKWGIDSQAIPHDFSKLSAVPVEKRKVVEKNIIWLRNISYPFEIPTKEIIRLEDIIYATMVFVNGEWFLREFSYDAHLGETLYICMNKAKVKHITITDKIYFKKEDVEDRDHLLSLFTYDNADEFLSTIEENDTNYSVPSNAYYKLEWETINDQRNFKTLDYQLEFSGKLRLEQEEAVNKFFAKGRARSGLLQAKPGWGKTFASCNLIARNNTKTLILVHTKLLFEQWLKEIALQIPNVIAGKIGDGNFTIGDVTVVIYKTAHNNLDKLRDEFSTLIVDEAHKCPADMFSHVVNNINAKVKIAITATPRRKDGKHVYLMDFFSQFKIAAEDLRDMAVPAVTIVKTDFKFAIIDPKRDWSRAMNKLCADDLYINLIAEKAIGYIKQGRCPLIIGDRVDMLKKLQKLIPASICVIGESSTEAREDALIGLGTTYKAILTTKLFDEGISCHRLDTLFFTCPSINNVQWEQRIGRIERLHPDKQFPLIVDFWLSGGVVTRQQTGRLAWYKQRGYNIL